MDDIDFESLIDAGLHVEESPTKHRADADITAKEPLLKQQEQKDVVKGKLSSEEQMNLQDSSVPADKAKDHTKPEDISAEESGTKHHSKDYSVKGELKSEESVKILDQENRTNQTEKEAVEGPRSIVDKPDFDSLPDALKEIESSLNEPDLFSNSWMDSDDSLNEKISSPDHSFLLLEYVASNYSLTSELANDESTCLCPIKVENTNPLECRTKAALVERIINETIGKNVPFRKKFSGNMTGFSSGIESKSGLEPEIHDSHTSEDESVEIEDTPMYYRFLSPKASQEYIDGFSSGTADLTSGISDEDDSMEGKLPSGDFESEENDSFITQSEPIQGTNTQEYRTNRDQIEKAIKDTIGKYQPFHQYVSEIESRFLDGTESEPKPEIFIDLHTRVRKSIKREEPRRFRVKFFPSITPEDSTMDQSTAADISAIESELKRIAQGYSVKSEVLSEEPMEVEMEPGKTFVLRMYLSGATPQERNNIPNLSSRSELRSAPEDSKEGNYVEKLALRCKQLKQVTSLRDDLLRYSSHLLSDEGGVVGQSVRKLASTVVQAVASFVDGIGERVKEEIEFIKGNFI